MPTPCFVIEQTQLVKRYLRRFVLGEEKCRANGYHNARVYVGTYGAVLDDRGIEHEPLVSEYAGDKRWPTRCSCGRSLTGDDVHSQVFTERIYAVTAAMPGALKAVGDTVAIRDGRAIAGAMWDAWWYDTYPAGPDGRRLMVMLPNGSEWFVDGRASNCTMTDDPLLKQHKCWTRTGEWPEITVGKDYGPTCAAGAGSILSGDYHGFLRGGILT